MATLKQIQANRRNALKSTGPKTPEGKAAVALNSLRHGLRARAAVLPGEYREEFQRLCDQLEAEWRPSTRTEQFYAEQLAVSLWKLRRADSAEASVLLSARAVLRSNPAAPIPLAGSIPSGAGLLARPPQSGTHSNRPLPG